MRDAIGGDTAELSRVRNRRSAETPAPEGVEIADADANGVPVRLYIPASKNRPKKIVLYFHGGGWVIGSIQSCSRFCGELAKAADVIVAAAAYRLAPEFPYPAAVHDCREAYLRILPQYMTAGRHISGYGDMLQSTAGMTDVSMPRETVQAETLRLSWRCRSGCAV